MPVLLLWLWGFPAAAKLLVLPLLAILRSLLQHTRLFTEMPLLRYFGQIGCDARERRAEQ